MSARRSRRRSAAGEAPLLHRASVATYRTTIYYVTERGSRTDLADSDYLRVVRGQLPDLLVAGWSDPAGVVGVDAHGAVDGVVLPGQLDSGAARFQVCTNCHDAGEPRLGGAGHHVVEVGGEILAVDVGMGVDEGKGHDASFAA